MSDIYIPPFTMTDEITNFVIEIAELTGAMTVLEQLSKNPKLRHENRIKSIQSSLAIEQNSLTLEQVSDIIDGKRVLGPPQDIREVQNAYEAYELMTKFNPYSIKDLLRAHKIMMDGLVKEAGIFRSKGVGVYAGENLIHAGTPANYVPDLVGQLFDWLKRSKLHPLVKSCIFHYEFEFIHPFADDDVIIRTKLEKPNKIKGCTNLVLLFLQRNGADGIGQACYISKSLILHTKSK